MDENQNSLVPPPEVAAEASPVPPETPPQREPQTYLQTQTIYDTVLLRRETERQQRAAAVQDELENNRISFNELFGKGRENTLSGLAYSQFMGDPTPDPDPTFTATKLWSRIEEAKKTLPEGYLGPLEEAHSDTHFEQIFRRQYGIWQNEVALDRAGWRGFGARMAAELLDPANLAISLATFQAGRVYGIARGSNLARIGGAAAGGAAGGISYEAMRAAYGADVDGSDLAAAAAFGAVAGGVLDSILINPATRQEVSALAHVTRKATEAAKRAAETAAEKVLMRPPTQAAVKRAEEAAKDAVTPGAPRAIEAPQGGTTTASEPPTAGATATPEPPTPEATPAPVEPPDAPATPTVEDRIGVVPTIQREGPDVTVAKLQEYQRRFGTEALLKEARQQGIKKLPRGTTEADIPAALVEAGKKQIIDRHMAAGGTGEPTWENVSARMQSAWEAGAARAAQGGTPEEVVQDALMAAGRQEPEAAAAPAPVKDQNVSLVEQLRGRPDNEPVPEEIIQTVLDAVDETPARAPGRARVLPTPKNLLKNPSHVLEAEGADGQVYRIFRVTDKDSGLYSYRVFNVSTGKNIAKDIDTLPTAREMIPGMTGEFTPEVMAQLIRKSGGMGPGDVRLAGGGKYMIRLADDQIAYSDRNYGIWEKPARGTKAEGEPMGFVALKQHRDGRWEVDMVEVKEEFQGRGLAAMLYEAVERDLGISMQPSGVLLPDGYKMWLKRNPDAVKWHREFVHPHNGKSEWLSPRRLTQDLALAKEQRDEYLKVGNKKLADQRQKAIDQLEAALKTVPPEMKTREAMLQMFRLPDELPSQGPIKPGVKEDLQKILRRVLPPSVKVEISDRVLFNGEEVFGAYNPTERLLRVALANTDPRQTAWHEVVHALRAFKLYTKDEWAALTGYARQKGIYERFDLDARYRDFYARQGATEDEIQDLIDEEAVTHLIGLLTRGMGPGGLIRDLLDKLVIAFRKFKQAIGLRFNNPDEIFDTIIRDMRSGGIASRDQYRRMYFGDEGALARASTMAALPPQNPNPPLGRGISIQQEDVPMPAMAKYRWDWAAVTQRSNNPVARLVMSHMLNDSVGKVDHRLNPFSVDQDQERTFRVYTKKFSSAFNPAYREWFRDMDFPMTEIKSRQTEFGNLITDYIRSKADGEEIVDFHPAVRRAGDNISRIHAEDWLKDLQNPLWREGGTGRSILGADRIEESDSYVWRKPDHEKVRGAVETYGMGEDEVGEARGVTLVVKNAIRSAQPDIPEDLLHRMALGYTENIYRRSAGLEDTWDTVFAEGTYWQVRDLLSNSGLFNEQEIETLLQRMNIQRPDGAEMSNLKRRVLLNERWVERNINGTGNDLAFRDLLENDITTLFFHESRRVSGRVALGRLRISHPRTGELLVNGITEDREWRDLGSIIDESANAYGMSRDEVVRERDRRNWIYDRIKGIPDKEQYGPLAENLRRWRDFNTMRLMGQVGIAQLGEFGEPLGALGMKAAMQHIPSLRTIIDEAGNQRLARDLLDEIQAMGIGVDYLHGWQLHKVSGTGEEPFEIYGQNSMKRRIDRALNMGSQATYGLSGQRFIQYMQELHVGAMVAQKFADMAVKPTLSRSDLKRMAQLGLDEAMTQRILNQFSNATVEPGWAFDRKLTRLNLDSWNDQQARAAFENAMFRYTRKLIQAQDQGTMALWMSHPMSKAFFQFRDFAFRAWANKALYNLHMADYPALMSMLYSIMWAGAVRGAQVQLIAAARSDGDQFREKNLTPWELGKAGFARSGWSSVIPMFTDTALYLGGGSPQFGNVRNSGQPSDGFFGSPMLTALDTTMKSSRSMVNSFMEGRELSQPELRGAISLLPFSNLLPITMATSALISDRAEKSPRIPLQAQ